MGLLAVALLLMSLLNLEPLHSFLLLSPLLPTLPAAGLTSPSPVNDLTKSDPD